MLKGKNWWSIIKILRSIGGKRNKRLAWKLEQILLSQETLQ